jgi:hypothetical protein
MASLPIVNSVNNESANRCVDFFVRADGTFGYKEFRREPEDQGAWFIIAFDESRSFARYDDALELANARVASLSKAVERAAPFVP